MDSASPALQFFIFHCLHTQHKLFYTGQQTRGTPLSKLTAHCIYQLSGSTKIQRRNLIPTELMKTILSSYCTCSEILTHSSFRAKQPNHAKIKDKRSISHSCSKHLRRLQSHKIPSPSRSLEITNTFFRGILRYMMCHFRKHVFPSLFLPSFYLQHQCTHIEVLSKSA